MTTTNPNFTDAEYEARIARTRAEMEIRGLDLMIISDPSNMNWITGYDGWTFYVHQAVLAADGRRTGLVGARHRRNGGPRARVFFSAQPGSIMPYG